MITIIDYGMGNLGSIVNMFKKVGASCEVSSDPERIVSSSKLLLPGVGAFDRAMERMHDMGLKTVLEWKVLKEKTPILGICLGMQLLTVGSEEGKLPGLGWIPADTTRFPKLPGLRIPHMGWNQVVPKKTSPLTTGLPVQSRFYFVHSYKVNVHNDDHCVMKCHYGIDFDAVLQRENIFGAQFHPEKSHRFGMRLFSNFAAM